MSTNIIDNICVIILETNMRLNAKRGRGPLFGELKRGTVYRRAVQIRTRLVSDGIETIGFWGDL